MQVVLVMNRTDGERRSFSIVRDVTVFGRREDCDFRIPLGDISRKHCRLVKSESSILVQDLGSSNGTYVNGTRIQESEVGAGDTIQIGGVTFVVQVDGVPGEEDIPSSSPAPHSAAIDHAATTKQSSSGEFDPLSALEDSNTAGLTESQIHRDLMSELGDSAASERQA